MTTSMSIDIADRDIIKMVEEFLANRHLDISLMCLERESGIINGVFSDDGLFLRQLILDGHWDDTLEFLQPLEQVDGYDKKKCQYLIYKHKYLELLCIKHDPGPLQNHEFTLDEVISCLTELEVLCTDRKEYDNLCFLLTLPSITADKAYKNWNPSSARISCFNQLYPLVKKFVGLEKRAPSHSSSKNDRLVNLLTKGLLYEMCVELCTARACKADDSVTVNHPLAGTPCSDADLSLVSWLQKVPAGTFACPFEKKALKLKVNELEKPSLEAVWSEQLLSTPIRPKQFPHTSIPARTRSSQIISQSMMAMYDGLSSHLYQSQNALHGSISEPRGRRQSGSPHLSRSYAASPSSKFLLTNSFRADRRSNPMNQSMERLFNTSGTSGPSSPRLRQSSPLVKDSTSSTTAHNTENKKQLSNRELISPPPATDISPSHSIAPRVPNPTERSMPTEQPSHNADLVSQQPRIPNINNPPITTHNANTQPVASHYRSNQPIASQYDHSQSGTHNQVTSQSAVNVHHSIQSNNSQHQQQHQQDVPSSSQQRPDLLQHDVSMSRSQNQNNIQPLPVRQSTAAGRVSASQDLYAQFQEQKKRIEEEMRMMEQRDEQWRQLQQNDMPGQPMSVQNSTAIPKLDLDQSVDYPPPTASSNPPKHPPDLSSDDITHEVNLDPSSAAGVGFSGGDDLSSIKQFVAVETLEEQGPVRAVAFHPSGECYAVGSNTKILRVCQYPDMSKVTTSYQQATKKPQVLAKKVKHHAGSIYCVAWNTLGSVIATGSNDHSVKCVQWLGDQNVFGSEKSLTLHDGTVRDVTFLSVDQLLSAGAGDCTVCLTDIASGAVVRRYKGHSGHVLSLYAHRDSLKFISGGQDKRALMWDTRMSVPVQTFQSSGGIADSAFASVSLDPAPRVLASGHDNSHCTLYDLRQGRLLQAWRPHTDEVRSARFNSDATYFLSGSYDTTVKLMDMQGDITQPLKTVQVAEHMDKVIQCRWHPLLPSFITSSADKTVTCWAIQIDD